MSAEQMLTTQRLYMKRHLMGPCRPGPGSTGKTLEERAWWLLAVSLLSVPTMDVVSCGLSSPLDLGPGISLEGNDAKAKTPVLWLPHAKS